jgi:hypothetical protein
MNGDNNVDGIEVCEKEERSGSKDEEGENDL